MQQLNQEQNKILKQKLTETIKQFTNENGINKELSKDLLLWFFMNINQKTDYRGGNE